LSDKDFKVKNKLQVKGITSAGPITADSSGNIDSVPYIATQYGGTGTTTSPSSGQILYSSSGTTYAPTTLSSLDVKGATYSDNAPSSPFVGQVWIESDSSSDSFDPNIMRRKSFTATAGQTVFTTDYVFIDGYEQVYFNGMLLLRNTDYTTVGSSSTVTLASAAVEGDIVEVVTITNLNSINAATTTTNTFTGNQVVSSDKYISIGSQSNIGISGAMPIYGLNINNSSSRPRLGLFDAVGGDTSGSSAGTIEFFDYLKTGQSEKRLAIIETLRDGSTATKRGGALSFSIVPDSSNSIVEKFRVSNNGISVPTDNSSRVGFSITDTFTSGSTTYANYGMTMINSNIGVGIGLAGWQHVKMFTNATERLAIDSTGLVTIPGALSTKNYQANNTLTLSSATTYSANTWYNLGTFPVTTSETFFCQFLIQMTDVGYHTYIGCFIMPATYWKNSGTLWTQTFVAEQHNGNNANVTVRLNTSSGNRSIDFQTDQSITVTTGGFVRLKMKRMFIHD